MRRRCSGTVIIEFAIGLPVIIFCLCVAINLGVTLMSARVVDLAARDAGRAASLCDTRSAAEQAVVSAVSAHTLFGQAPTAKIINFDDNGGVACPDKGPGPIVSVEVSHDVKLPFPGVFYGVGFESDHLGFQRNYTFPIIKLKQSET